MPESTARAQAVATILDASLVDDTADTVAALRLLGVTDDELGPLAGPVPDVDAVTDEQLDALLDAQTRQRDGTSVHGYLLAMLAASWHGEMSDKYGMTGESDWRYDLYDPLVRLGLLSPYRSGWGIEYAADGGDRDPGRRQRADDLIARAIGRIGAPVQAPDVAALDMDDFTAAIAAADLAWSAELGDPPSDPDYIRALAAGVRRTLLGTDTTPTTEETT